jgi:hypothetical protein
MTMWLCNMKSNNKFIKAHTGKMWCVNHMSAQLVPSCEDRWHATAQEL